QPVGYDCCRLKTKNTHTATPKPHQYNGSGPNAVSQLALATKALGITAAGRVTNFYYDDNGNLTQKTVKLGSTEQLNAATYRTIKYNSNNKPTKITNQNGTTTDFNYGSDGLRYKQQTGNKTTHYVAGGSYEVEIESGKTTSRAYIGDYAIMTRSTGNGIFGLQYIHRDRLGSVDTITDGNTLATLSTVSIMQVEQRTYNAFGKARTATGAREADGTEGNGLLPDDPVTPRGFTDHEHLGGSGLIHMNGRAYDPELGRFLSVDPFISMPENGQSLNPYSYVMNNPLKYTDPSGYVGRLTLKERNNLAASGASDVQVVQTKNSDGSVTREIFAIESVTGPTVTVSSGANGGSVTRDASVDSPSTGSPTIPVSSVDYVNDPSITAGLDWTGDRAMAYDQGGQKGLDAYNEGVDTGFEVAMVVAPIPSIGKLKAVEKAMAGLAKLRVVKGAIAGAEKAFVDSRKITEYVLNLSHPKGGHKARVFNSILGITIENSSSLTSQLLKGVMKNSATLKGTTKYGTQYQVMIPVRGPKGIANVTTGWIVKVGENFPRLTSAYIDTKKAF
ncbi:MAG: RHS repeat-associated core domain-containing protein, partial [Algicola sp.]|nr:RHS repeat-associated core domain-containing protein [Algicola sp.]